MERRRNQIFDHQLLHRTVHWSRGGGRGRREWKGVSFHSNCFQSELHSIIFWTRNRSSSSLMMDGLPPLWIPFILLRQTSGWQSLRGMMWFKSYSERRKRKIRTDNLGYKEMRRGRGRRINDQQKLETFIHSERAPRPPKNKTHSCSAGASFGLRKHRMLSK